MDQPELQKSETLGIDLLRQKLAALELERETTYKKIDNIDQRITKLRKKIDLCALSNVDEDILSSIVASEINAHDNVDQRIPAAQVPESMMDAGQPGQMCYDSMYLYLCILPNTWRRISLIMWSQK